MRFRFQYAALLRITTIPSAFSSIWSPTTAGVVEIKEDEAPFNFVEATLVLPETIAIQRHSETVNATMWIGVDGWHQGNITEWWRAGVTVKNTPGTDTSYNAFWQWFPAPSREPVDFPIDPGDRIHINVSIWNGGYNGRISLTNLRTGWTTQHVEQAVQSHPLRGDTAAFMLGDSTDSSNKASELSAFRSAGFLDGRVCKADGACFRAGRRNHQRLEMVRDNSTLTETIVEDGKIQIKFVDSKRILQEQ